MGYCDLCINVKDENIESLHRLLMRLYEMGYKTVAINQIFDESIFETEQKKKKKSQSENPKMIIKPYQFDSLKNEFNGKLNILSRITFSYSDPGKTYLINQSNVLNKFDIYAVIPKGQAAFQFACAQLNADIISVNGTSTGLKFNRKLYFQAVERGLHFEIQYVDLILSTTRKMALHYSHLFYIYGKSKNVIISSGTADYALIRNPYDIINLGRILGLSELKAKASIHRQCQHLILQSEGRRYGKALFTIHNDEKIILENSINQHDRDESPAAKKFKL